MFMGIFCLWGNGQHGITFQIVCLGSANARTPFPNLLRVKNQKSKGLLFYRAFYLIIYWSFFYKPCLRGRKTLCSEMIKLRFVILIPWYGTTDSNIFTHFWTFGMIS